LKYKQRNAFTADPELQAKHIEDMNVPVQERKTLMGLDAAAGFRLV
jgi:hypothetical protein